MLRHAPRAFVLWSLAVPASGGAEELLCTPVEAGVIHADGILDDWEGVAGIEVGGHDADASFTLRCNYEPRWIYFAIDVRDDSLARSRDAAPAEDHVELAFADGAKIDRLIVYPADPRVRARRITRWSSGRSLRGVEVGDARQPRGFAVEVKLARSAVPGFGPGAPVLRMAAIFSDADSRTHPTVKRVLASGPTDAPGDLPKVEFPEQKSALDAFLADVHLATTDVVFDRVARVRPGEKGRAVIAGPYLAMITDEYAYASLPIPAGPAGRRDLLDIQLLDLAGDGRDAIVVRYVDRGSELTREVLAAYRVGTEGLKRVFGVEVARSRGDRRLTTKVGYTRNKRGVEILVEAKPAVGWNAANYEERPPEDLAPIPTPWGDKRARFRFRGDEYLRAE